LGFGGSHPFCLEPAGQPVGLGQVGRQPVPGLGGRPWIEDRAVLGGINDVLRARQPWFYP
jgi:hypothetical protein